MLELRRNVRFCLNDSPAGAGGGSGAGVADKLNTWSAWPAMRGLGRYYEIDVVCRGKADPQTGYFINIKQIDQAVREHALPVLRRALDGPGSAAEVPLGGLLHDLLSAVQPALGNTVVSLTLWLTPRVGLAMRSEAMHQVILRQEYEFAAAHRLHVPELSDEANREIFGKCNNPAGHGHNYRLDVAVRLPVGDGGRVPPVEVLDEIVDVAVITPLDHKHLNDDVAAFAELNPSVENIAKVIWDMLAPQIGGLTADGRASLEEVRVWETGKTSCTYRGE